MIKAVSAARAAVEAAGKKATAKQVRSASKTLRLYKPDTVQKCSPRRRKKRHEARLHTAFSYFVS
jgi:hypothetical protein